MTRLAGMVLLFLIELTRAGGPAAGGSHRQSRQRLHPGADSSAQVSIGDDHHITKEDGRFRTGPIQPGTLMLEVRAIGYLAHSRSLVIQPGQHINLVIELAPVTHRVDSITVVARRDPSISGDDLAHRGGDLATALNGWQGIVVSRTGHGNEAIPQIRGSAADEVLVLVDGFALNDPFTGRADLSRIPVQDIETTSAATRGSEREGGKPGHGWRHSDQHPPGTSARISGRHWQR